MRNVTFRPFRASDAAQLDLFREHFEEAELEMPYGYAAEGIVETGVAEKDGELLASLSGTFALVCDPLVKNPQADPRDLMVAVWGLERVLAYIARQYGAVDSYIAIPDSLPQFHRIVEACGYRETVQHCKVFRRSLRDSTEVDEAKIQSLAAEAAEAVAAASYDSGSDGIS